MREWTINIEELTDRADENMADRLVDVLAEYAPAVSFGHGRLGMTLNISAETSGQAVDIAVRAFMRAVNGPATHVAAELAA